MDTRTPSKAPNIDSNRLQASLLQAKEANATYAQKRDAILECEDALSFYQKAIDQEKENRNLSSLTNEKEGPTLSTFYCTKIIGLYKEMLKLTDPNSADFQHLLLRQFIACSKITSPNGLDSIYTSSHLSCWNIFAGIQLQKPKAEITAMFEEWFARVKKPFMYYNTVNDQVVAALYFAYVDNKKESILQLNRLLPLNDLAIAFQSAFVDLIALKLPSIAEYNLHHPKNTLPSLNFLPSNIEQLDKMLTNIQHPHLKLSALVKSLCKDCFLYNLLKPTSDGRLLWHGPYYPDRLNQLRLYLNQRAASKDPIKGIDIMVLKSFQKEIENHPDINLFLENYREVKQFIEACGVRNSPQITFDPL